MVLFGYYHIVVMSSDRLGFSVKLVVLRSQSVAEIFGLSPQLGLEPAPHTSVALSERYLNGSQFILGNQSFRRPHPPA